MLIGLPAWFLAWATFGATTDGFAVGTVTVPAATVGLLAAGVLVLGLWLLRGRPRWPAITAIVTGIVLAILALDLFLRWRGSGLLGELDGLQMDEHDSTTLAAVWLLGAAAVCLMIAGATMLRDTRRLAPRGIPVT